MIEADQYCVDILKQTYVVRKAIEKLEALLLEGHLQSCVPLAVFESSSSGHVDAVMELFTLLATFAQQGNIEGQRTTPRNQQATLARAITNHIT